MKKGQQVSFFSRIGNFVFPASVQVKKVFISTYTKIVNQLKVRPLTSFVVVLVLLLGLIILPQTVFKPKPAEKNIAKIVKEVETFEIGKSPTITTQAKIEKSGVIQIYAQAPGIVSKVYVKEGKQVSRGTLLVSLANNYQGASAASVQRQLAQAQYLNAKNTLDLQKDLIKKQRELADKSDSSSDDLRDITSKSLDETRDLITLNENIVESIDTNLKTLEDTNISGSNDSLILQTKQLKAQIQSGLNQARSGLRQAEYSANSDKTPAQISNLSKDIVQKQLDLQEKSLNLGLETARLQLKLTQINESIMFPTSPFAATVQRVFVKPGQTVNPGTLLATLSGTQSEITAIALVPRTTALSVNKLESSYLLINNKKIEASPLFVSTEATNGQLYSVIYQIPSEFKDYVTDQGFVDVEIPTGNQSFSTVYPFIPLDSVHQTQDSAVVFVISDNKANGKQVTLGEVQGNYVQIIDGLSSSDVVILDRSIITGDKVKDKSK